MSEIKTVFARASDRESRYFDNAGAEIAAVNTVLMRLVCLFGALLSPLFIFLLPSLLGAGSFVPVWLCPLLVCAAFFVYTMLSCSRSGSPGWICALFCALLTASLILCGVSSRTAFAPLAPFFIAVMPALFIIRPLVFTLLILLGSGVNIAASLLCKDAAVSGIDAAATSVAAAFSLLLLYIMTRLRIRDYYSRMKFRRMSMMDRLTGVLNKSTFEEYARGYLETREPGGIYAFFIVDLDNFKSVNDTLGHQAGDDMIECAGNCLAGCFRSYDIVGRIGGDEFAVLMKDVTMLSAVSRKASEVLRAIQSESFERIGHTVSCSLGGVYSSSRLSYEDIFASADSALYRAKRAGRARAVICAAAARGGDERVPDDRPRE